MATDGEGSSSTVSRRELTVTAGVGAVALLAGCTGGDDDESEAGTQGDGGDEGGLVIVDHEPDDPGDTPGNYIVEGTAETDESVEYAAVIAAFYDSNGEELGWRGGDTREDGLEAGETWEFSINPGYTHEDDVDDYEIGITDDEEEFNAASQEGELP